MSPSTGIGALAEVDGQKVAIGNRRLMESEGMSVSEHLGARRDEIANGGRTAVFVAVDDRAVGVIGIADAVRETSAATVTVRWYRRSATPVPAPGSSTDAPSRPS